MVDWLFIVYRRIIEVVAWEDGPICARIRISVNAGQWNLDHVTYQKAKKFIFSLIQHQNAHHDKVTDVDDNLTIPDIMDKIDLEILRLCITLPVNADRDKTQQVNTNQVVIVNGQTGIQNILALV